MWWIFLFPMAHAQPAPELPELRVCGEQMARSMQYADTLADELCNTSDGPSQIFAHSAPVIIDVLNDRLSPTQRTLQLPEDERPPTLLTDTIHSRSQLVRIVGEDLLETEMCLQSLCRHIADSCAATQNYGVNVTFQEQCRTSANRLMDVQYAKAELLIEINIRHAKDLGRWLAAWSQMRHLFQSWMGAPMADLLGDVRGFVGSTTGLIRDPL